MTPAQALDGDRVGGPPALSVGYPGPEERELTGEELVGQDGLDADPTDRLLGEHARHDDQAEQHRDEEVEEIVPGVDRRESEPERGAEAPPAVARGPEPAPCGAARAHRAGSRPARAAGTSASPRRWQACNPGSAPPRARARPPPGGGARPRRRAPRRARPPTARRRRAGSSSRRRLRGNRSGFSRETDRAGIRATGASPRIPAGSAWRGP